MHVCVDAVSLVTCTCVHLQCTCVYVQFSFIPYVLNHHYISSLFQAHLRRWVDVLVQTVTAKTQRKGDVSDWNYYI